MIRLPPWYGAMVVSLVLVSAASCTGPSGDAPAGSMLTPFFGVFAYGCRVQDLGAGDYSIVVRATGVTPARRAADNALLQAARLALEKKAPRFTVVHSKSLVFTRTIATIMSIPTSLGLFPMLPESTTVEDRIIVLVIHLGSAHPNPEASTIDTQAVIDRLGP